MTRVDRPSSGAPAPPALVLLAAVVLLGFVGAFVLVPAARDLTVAASGLVAVTGLVAGCLLHRPRPLLPWLLLTAATACFLLGYAVRPWSAEQTGVWFYLADVPALTGYLALLVGLGVLARFHGGLGREVVCDVLVLGVAGALAVFQHLVVPGVLVAGRPPGLVALAAAYPLVDVLLLCLLLDVLLTAPPRRSHQLLTAGVSALLVGDLVYGWWTTRGVLLPPDVVNLAYLLAFLLSAAAACHPSQRGAGTRVRSARGRDHRDGAASDRAVQVAGLTSRPEAWTWPRLVALGLSLGALVVLLAGRSPQDPAATGWAGVVAVALVLGLLVVRAVSAVNGLAGARAVLAQRASHDALTNLPNRDEVHRLLDERCAHPTPEGRAHWLLSLDLDGFKRVNDSWGHSAGDQLLLEVARRLRGAAPAGAVVGRLAGDEFVLVVTTSRDDVAVVAQRLLDVIAAPVRLDAAEVVVTASVGVTGLRSGTRTALREADAAMYAAKRSGRCQWLLYDDTMRRDQDAAVELEMDLRRAVARGDLHVAHQLVVDIEDGRPVGSEALLRWDRGPAGAVPPTVFVPVLEDTGLVVPVGAWVLGESLAQWVRWRSADVVDDSFTVSVNVAPRQLLDPGFAGHVGRLLAEHGVPGANLVLEITESAMLSGADVVLDNLAGVRALGAGLAVDDFGTGYSALGYLRTLPVTRVKIDRTFVQGLGTGRDDEALVRAVVAVADALGLAVTAEGIETPLQRDVLHAMGVRHGQGWLWSRAATEPETTRDLVRAGRPGTAQQEVGSTS